MNFWSLKSRLVYDTLDPRLQNILNEVLQIIDITLLEGYRGEEKQNEYFNSGLSKLKFPKSKHNRKPSLAVDCAIWNKEGKHIRWCDKRQFFFLAGIITAIAEKQNVKIRWGGDWDGDRNFDDQKFNDLPHFEIIE